MKPNHLQAFQSKHLKNSLQPFRGRGGLMLVLGVLFILVMTSGFVKSIDFSSWLSSENTTKPSTNFVVNPTEEQIKAMVSHPVRSIKIYPNPITGQLILSFDKTLENATVQVYDQNGKSVFMSEDQDGKTLQLDISEFPKGNYLINVEDNHYNYYSSKFVRK